jgi:ADP-heptose:LPS heptosyltransferase/tetratricopeptide (TPR) repeat protein
MTKSIPKLLKRLWQSKASTTATGFAPYDPSAERVLSELRHAYSGVRNLLVVRLDAIGDNFLFADGMRKLRQLFPGADLTVLTYSENGPLYERSTYVNKVILLDREALVHNKDYREARIKELRESVQSWELLINPLYSREYLAEEIVMAIPAQCKIGVAGDNSNISREIMQRNNPFLAALLPVDTSVVRHELHRNNEICSLLGSSDATIALRFPLTAEDRQFADHFISEYKLGRYGVVFPGTKGGTLSPKYWGSENYASLIDHLKLEIGTEVVMMLGPTGEDNILSEISSAMRSAPCVLAGDASIWQAAALLERASFYVGSDTSVAHIAAALKVPTFVMLGGGHYGRFFPYPEGSAVTCLTHKLECFNCYWKCSQPYNKCIADITVADVLDGMADTLAHARSIGVAAGGRAIKGFNVGTVQSKRLRVDLVFSYGMHSWHLQEALALTLEKAGSLNRVFRVSPQTTAPFFEYLRSGGWADLILAMGGDHHLSFLHDTEEKRDAWHKYRGHRVCNSFESSRDSLYKKYVPRLKTALRTFSHFIYSDEVDQLVFDRAGVKSLWWPQATDHRMFYSQTKMSQRVPRVFFCGKLWDEYPLRRAFMEALQQAQLGAQMTGISTGELVANYNKYMLAINPPGVLGGFNVRTFEAMSCGSLMLQFLPHNRPANNALFKHGQHLLYFDSKDPKRLRELAQSAVAHPDWMLGIAQCGHEEVLQHHTVEIRLRQLIEWLFENKAPAYPQYGDVAEAAQEARNRKYINDRYLFEDRIILNREARNEFSDLQFLDYGDMSPRLCKEGERLVSQRRVFEARRVFKRALDMDSDAMVAHNNLGVLCWRDCDRLRAFRHFEAALVEDPCYRPAVVNYAEALRISGRAVEARVVYMNYLHHDPCDAGIRALADSVA